MNMPRGYLSVPRAFLILVMPTLSDTELRVLLVVLWRTVGWIEKGKVRHRAWIARSVFVTETGRSADAISRSTQSLIDKGFLKVTSETGKAVEAASRSLLPRLYFEPALERLGFVVEATEIVPRDRVLNYDSNISSKLTTLESQNTTHSGVTRGDLASRKLETELDLDHLAIEEQKRAIRDRFSKLNL